MISRKLTIAALAAQIACIVLIVTTIAVSFAVFSPALSENAEGVGEAIGLAFAGFALLIVLVVISIFGMAGVLFRIADTALLARALSRGMCGRGTIVMLYVSLAGDLAALLYAFVLCALSNSPATLALGLITAAVLACAAAVRIVCASSLSRARKQRIAEANGRQEAA